MHRTARHALLSAITSLMFATHTISQEIEGDIPVDLARALIGEHQPFQIRFFAGLPEQFPEIELPADSELLGSVDMVNSQRVVLQVTGDGITQRTQLISELEALGYLMITQPHRVPPQQRGFVAQMPIPAGMPIQLCHDNLGTLTLRIGVMGSMAGVNPAPSTWAGGGGAISYTPFANAVPAGRFVRNELSTATDSLIYITQTNYNERPFADMSCQQLQEQTQARSEQSGFQVMNLQQHMPRIELPEEATTPDASGQSMRGLGGPGFMAESRTQVSLDWPMDQLLDHLSNQIDEQGWQRDHLVSGDVAASGVWTREVDEWELVGILRIVRLEATEFELVFSLQNQPESQTPSTTPTNTASPTQ